MSLDNIAEVIFNNRKSRTLVIGPDAFAVDRGELGFHDDKDFETVYDMLVDELIKQSGQAVTRPHDTHDLFVATEKITRKKEKKKEKEILLNIIILYSTII